ncbi:MAG: LysR substrate-binding domain-containing protein [Nonlabens sp.]
MTITQLKYVLAVAQHQNFTRAANAVFVTQPTLSMQIHKLEEELDIQIFDRSKKPIQLTDAGKKIVQQAKNIVDESDRIQDIVDQEKGFIGGDFRLGIIPTVMPTLLPMFLQTFNNRYPKVKLRIQELTTENILEGLQDGSLDAAIAATPLEMDYIKERILYYEPFVAYGSSFTTPSNGKLKIEDIDLDSLLLLEDGHCFKNSVINLCRSSLNNDQKKFLLESGSFETLIKLSDEGLGMTLLPYLNTIDLKENRKSNLRSFEAPVPAREVSMIYHKSGLRMQIINALFDTIAGIVKGAIAFQDVKIISPKSKGRS